MTDAANESPRSTPRRLQCYPTALAQFISISFHFVYFFLAAVTYPNCWNGVQGSTYKGSQSTTASGSSCQRWDSDFPHDHEYIDDDAAFASDGTVTDAANYCRDPAHDFNEPWCYSLDPGTGAEACGIPQCSGKFQFSVLCCREPRNGIISYQA